MNHCNGTNTKKHLNGPITSSHPIKTTSTNHFNENCDTESCIIDKLPFEIWEKILFYLDCDTWRNLAKTFDVIDGIITSIKKKEIEKCKKSLKRMHFEHFLELQEMSRDPKKISKQTIIESYVNFWKFHSVDKIKLKALPYSDNDNDVIHCINMSGRWVFLYSTSKVEEGFSGFKMIHLDTMARYQYSVPWIHVEKFTFHKSANPKAKTCHKSSKSIQNCWCNTDLSHDDLQVLLPLNLRILQGGMVSNFVQLHPFQPVNTHTSDFSQRHYAKTGDFYVTCGKFQLIFDSQFEFDEDSFQNQVNTPLPHVYVFQGNPGASQKRRRLLDISVCPEPNIDTFRAILHILDQVNSQYKILFLLGTRILFETPVPCLFKAWLFRGSTLLGLCSAGKLFLASNRGKLTDAREPGLYTSACLRVNLLVLGTRAGQLLVYRVNCKISRVFQELNFGRPDKELRICTEAISQVMFVASTPGPELLVLTAMNKLYHVKL